MDDTIIGWTLLLTRNSKSFCMLQLQHQSFQYVPKTVLIMHFLFSVFYL